MEAMKAKEQPKGAAASSRIRSEVSGTATRIVSAASLRGLDLIAYKCDLSPQDKPFAIADYVEKTFFGLKPRISQVGAARSSPSTQIPLVGRKDAGIAVYRDQATQLLCILYRDVVLRFKPELDAGSRRKLLTRYGLMLPSHARIEDEQVVASCVDPHCRGDELLRFAAALDAEQDVVFAAPDFVSQFSRTASPRPGKPSHAQWHLDLIGAETAWGHTHGGDFITIAILDDGVDIDHPELKPNLRLNPVPSQPLDRYGRDFCFKTRERALGYFNPRPKKFHPEYDNVLWNDIHGTACAGVAVGTGPKAYGIAPGCKFLPVKIFRTLPKNLDPDGNQAIASDSAVAAAIRYAALEAGADILSCSWVAPWNKALENAIKDSRKEGRDGRGTVVVCATGNDTQNRIRYPAYDPHAIAVGASSHKDELAQYSNYGDEVCVLAPSNGDGRGIFTTDVDIKGRGYNPAKKTPDGTLGPYTDRFGGTSSATALVAGLCGLMLSLKPEMTAEDVRAALIASAKKIGPTSAYKANGHSNTFGYGRIDAANAMAHVKTSKTKVKKPRPDR